MISIEKIILKFLDTVEFNNDMQKSVWRSINPNETDFVTSVNQFYRQIYDFRQGIHIIRTDSLASLR